MPCRRPWGVGLLLMPACVLSAEPALRRPVDLVAAGDTLLVANEGTGTISVVRPVDRSVLAEIPVARRLSALEGLHGGRWLLAADPSAGELLLVELLLVELRGAELRVAQRRPTPAGPLRLRADAAGKRCAVSSRWARRVSFFAIDGTPETPSLTAGASVDIPFAPRDGLFSADGALYLAADAFGGELRVLDAATGADVRRLSLPGHNIRGLALRPDGSELLVAHQILNPGAATTHGNVFWGELMGNVLRSIDPDSLFSKDAPAGVLGREVAIERGTHPLGQPGNAAGDPGAIAVTPGGHTFVCLTGVSELALQYPPNTPFTRIAVGRGPIAVAASPDHREAYVLCRFDDTLSIIDLEQRASVATLPLGPRREPTLAERGEELFHDARLSLDGWYSCHSCHTDGHANGLLNDGLADGTYGTPKRVPSLLGATDTAPWAWNGGRESLEEQARKSVAVTMQGGEERATDENVAALAAYIRSLAPPPSLALARGETPGDAVARGQRVFAERRCGDCHEPPFFTSDRSHDVGLADEKGLDRFNPPSLRGVSQRGPYLHDGSAATVRDVLLRRGHPRGATYEPRELEELLEYLARL